MKKIRSALSYTILVATLLAVPMAEAEIYLVKDNKVVATYSDNEVDYLTFEDPTVYDVSTVSKFLEQVYYGDALTEAPYNHALRLTDYDYDHDTGVLPSEATYYMLRLHAPESDNPSIPLLHAGTYTLGNGGTDYTICGEECSYVVTDGIPHYFAEARMVVEYDGYDTMIRLTATDKEGVTYTTSFKGKTSFDDQSIHWIKTDTHINGGTIIAAYLPPSQSGDLKCNMNITIAEKGYDKDGWLVMPNNYLRFVGNVELDENNQLASGTWKIISAEKAERNTFLAGKCINFLDGAFPVHTALFHYVDSDNVSVGLITEGTVNVDKTGDNYTVSYNLTTREGKKVSGTYTGPIEVEGYENPRLLDTDYELDLKDAEAEYAKLYDGTVRINLATYNKRYRYVGDNLSMELLPDEDGFREGTYSFTPNGESVGTIEPGFWEPDLHWGTVFTLYPEDGSQDPVKGAAIAGGSVTFTKNADGTWTIDINFIDDQPTPHSITGSWTGTLDVK